MKKIGYSVNSWQGQTDHKETDEQIASNMKISNDIFLCTSEAGSWPDDLWDLQVSEM